ncbi:hypothetical protein PanWU01x14_093370 [Parasponia andersonii]|uniref:Uncharacterized protein n=1 Tax=Parasponia andersonii TaxID=3476 RepID=A0A2P5D5Z4_PARAD|nr:hypothetical protein PanWU01x14_093370 [Parasponia andersonii]
MHSLVRHLLLQNGIDVENEFVSSNRTVLLSLTDICRVNSRAAHKTLHTTQILQLLQILPALSAMFYNLQDFIHALSKMKYLSPYIIKFIMNYFLARYSCLLRRNDL